MPTQISFGKQLNPFIQPRQQMRDHRCAPLIYKVKIQAMRLRWPMVSVPFSQQSLQLYVKRRFRSVTLFGGPQGQYAIELKIKFKFRPVSKLEVERDLKSINSTKSTGIDNLPPCLLKDTACNLSAPLAHPINLSLQTGTFPADWKLQKLFQYTNLVLFPASTITGRFKYFRFCLKSSKRRYIGKSCDSSKLISFY